LGQKQSEIRSAGDMRGVLHESGNGMALRTRQNEILEDLSSSSAGINEADLGVLKTLLTISAPQPKPKHTIFNHHLLGLKKIKQLAF
jgi:hypothetical protein